MSSQRDLLDDVGPELRPLVESAAELLSGGKRLRPAFCYWGWRGVLRGPSRSDDVSDDADDAPVVAVGAALELFQAAALVHDDLIDGSDTRRGRPSAHRQFARMHRAGGWSGSADGFGAAAAVLLGDLLLGWSDELFFTAGLSASAAARARPVYERMRTEVGAGQYLDVLEQASGASRPDGQAGRARRVIRYKSARYSVEHPLMLGGHLAGAGPDLLAAYSGYGAALGEAFQLRDDILGVFGDPSLTGKPAGDDLREGKRTLLVAYATERAAPAQLDLLTAALGDPGVDEERVAALREVFVATGALARVESLVSTLVGAAAAALTRADVTADARAALTALIEAAAVRTR